MVNLFQWRQALELVTIYYPLSFKTLYSIIGIDRWGNSGSLELVQFSNHLPNNQYVTIEEFQLDESKGTIYPIENHGNIGIYLFMIGV